MCFLNLFCRKPRPVPADTPKEEPMLRINNLNGFGAGGSLSLTQKGYGYIETATTGNMTMSYANVQSGSAPSAGDLVVWMVGAVDTAAQAINDMTGSGWAQSRAYTDPACASVLAKVVAAGDVASPGTIVTAPTNGAAGLWIAYSVSGSIASLTAGGLSIVYSGASDPGNASLNASASALAVMLSYGFGTVGTSLAWSGATPDIQLERANVTNVGGLVGDWEWFAKRSSPGDSITVSKGDDGSENIIAVGYISVT